MNEIKISVIIPVYNTMQYLTDCLDSVIHQSLQEIEIICVDDCSTDGSLKILREYAQRDTRILVIHFANNQGEAMARNRALMEAKGKYIFFLDSDDYLDLTALEELYLRADRDRLDICYFKMKQRWELAGICCDSTPKGIEGIYSEVYTGIELFDLFIDKREFFYYPCLGVYRREFVRKNNLKFRKLLIGQGGLFTLQGILAAQRVSVQDGQYYTYRLREGSSSKGIYDNYPVVLGNFVQFAQMLKRICEETNEQTISVLKRYLDYQIMQIRSGISGSSHIAHTIYEQLSIEYEKYIFKCIFMQQESYFKEFTVEELEELKCFKNIILYGAGHAASDVLRALDKHGLSISAIAVSNKMRNPISFFGHKVCEIRDLMQYRENSIILVSVNRKYHDSIVDILQKLGFLHYILLNIRI